MAGRYEIYLCRDTGERLRLISDFTSLKYSFVTHDLGVCILKVPDSFDPQFLIPDYKIAVWREPDGGSMALENVYMIRRWVVSDDSQGRRSYELTGVDGNDLAVNRNVDSKATTYKPYIAPASAPIDNVIKATVRDQLASTGTSSQKISAGYFSVQADSSQAASFKKTIKYRTIREYASAMLETSRSRNGAYMFWRVVALSEAEYQFQTYLGQIGQDRSWPDGYNPILASIENGNMSNPTYVYDAVDAKNVTEGLGVNLGSVTYPERRATERVVDKARGAYNLTSVYSHRAIFIDYGSDAGAEVQEALLDEIGEYEPIESFSFDFVDTPSQTYGRDWKYGDRITAFYNGTYYTCRINGVVVSIQGTEDEKVSVSLDIEPLTDPELE